MQRNYKFIHDSQVPSGLYEERDFVVCHEGWGKSVSLINHRLSPEPEEEATCNFTYMKSISENTVQTDNEVKRD